MNKKMLLSILILAFVGIGTAGTWATVNSVEDSAATGAITVTQPTLTLDYSSIATAITADGQKVEVGKLVFTPGDMDLKIVNEAINSVTASGSLSDDIILYARPKDGTGTTDVALYGPGVTFTGTGALGYAGTTGTSVNVPIYAAFINDPVNDQTTDVTSSNVQYTVTGIMTTTV